MHARVRILVLWPNYQNASTGRALPVCLLLTRELKSKRKPKAENASSWTAQLKLQETLIYFSTGFSKLRPLDFNVFLRPEASQYVSADVRQQ